MRDYHAYNLFPLNAHIGEQTSAWTARMLMKMKFSRGYLLADGWQEWLTAGYSVEPRQQTAISWTLLIF
jgi:hypothetical protein